MVILIKSAVETSTGRFLAVVLLFLLADAMIEVQARIPRFVPSASKVPPGRYQSQRLSPQTDPSHRTTSVG
jgi:hypothetical protein